MKAGPDELTVEFAQDGIEMRSGRWGGMHISHTTLPAGCDLSPLLALLPDGLCSGDHYGTVLDGEITVRYGDGSEETSRAGDLFYWPAGHTAWTGEGVVFIAITPLDQVERMDELMAEAG